jgi:hypothetical protein
MGSSNSHVSRGSLLAPHGSLLSLGQLGPDVPISAVVGPVLVGDLTATVYAMFAATMGLECG